MCKLLLLKSFLVDYGTILTAPTMMGPFYKDLSLNVPSAWHCNFGTTQLHKQAVYKALFCLEQFRGIFKLSLPGDPDTKSKRIQLRGLNKNSVF